MSLLSSSSELIQLQEMDSSSQASSERIILEPYKYLLQLPGESLFCLTSEHWDSDAEVLGTKLVGKRNIDSSHFLFCPLLYHNICQFTVDKMGNMYSGGTTSIKSNCSCIYASFVRLRDDVVLLLMVPPVLSCMTFICLITPHPPQMSGPHPLLHNSNIYL